MLKRSLTSQRWFKLATNRPCLWICLTLHYKLKLRIRVKVWNSFRNIYKWLNRLRDVRMASYFCHTIFDYAEHLLPTMATSVPPVTQDTKNVLSKPKTIQELVLVIFIHGFKGTESTFGEFPSLLGNALSESIPGVKAECIVFPAYEVRWEIFCGLYSINPLFLLNRPRESWSVHKRST